MSARLEFSVRLMRTSRSERPPVAWFLPGDEPRRWFDEIARWEVSLAHVRLLLVPRSARDRDVCGVLVVPPPERAPHVGAWIHPYGLAAGGRLYLPVDAELDPGVGEEELGSLLLQPISVFHPTAGLVGYATSDVLTAADFLERPLRREAVWGGARPGTTVRSRLLSVEPERPPQVEGVLRGGGEGIGDGSLGDLGSTGSRTLDAVAERIGLRRGSWLRRGAGGVVRVTGGMLAVGGTLVGGALRSLGGLLGGTGGGRGGAADGAGATGRGSSVPRGPSWLDRFFGRLAGSGGAGVSALSGLAGRLAGWLEGGEFRLRGRHDRLAHRLLDLLSRDPERALHFAPPLGTGEGFRGIVPTTGSLRWRLPYFSLERLFGGGQPGSVFEVSPDLYEELRREYRKIADRELRRGQYRRAAYIFSELLQDFDCTAAALRDGGYYREAAVLFREKLDRPLEAASCLEQGGLLLEAVVIFEEHREFEKAGDLYTRLERSEEAEASYRKAVELHRERGDLVVAGELLEKKVRAFDEALALYDSGWPSSRQAGRCLAQSFRVLFELGRHDDALSRLALLRNEKLPLSRRILLAETLVRVSKTYPEPGIAALAADTVRVVAGRGLERADLGSTQALVRSVRDLVPEDRLLRRDVELYVDRRRRRQPSPTCTPTDTRDFRLRAGVRWKAVAEMRRFFFAAGFDEDGVVLVLGRFGEFLEEFRWALPIPGEELPLLLAVSRIPQPTVFLKLVGGPALKQRSIPVGGGRTALLAGTPDWLPASTVALAAEGNQVWVAAAYEDSLILTLRGGLGKLYSSHQIGPVAHPVTLAARWGRLFVGAGRRLRVFEHHGRSQLSHSGPDWDTEFPGDIRQLVAAPAHLEPLLAISTPERAILVSPLAVDGAEGRYAKLDSRGAERLPTGPDLRVGFTRHGVIVAAGRRCASEGTASAPFSFGANRHFAIRGQFDVPNAIPVEVVPGPGPRDIAIFFANGQVLVRTLK